MPDDNRRPPRQDNRLHGDSVMQECFTEKRYGQYDEDEVSISLRACSASIGGGPKC